NAAHRVVFEALAGMAARRRDAADAEPGQPARSYRDARANRDVPSSE
ncbi:agmatinase, partial [Mycobacterium sp. ITM-2017-0098]